MATYFEDFVRTMAPDDPDKQTAAKLKFQNEGHLRTVEYHAELKLEMGKPKVRKFYFALTCWDDIYGECV